MQKMRSEAEQALPSYMLEAMDRARATSAETITNPIRYFDEHGPVSRELMALQEILAALKRIEGHLEKTSKPT